MAGKAGRGWQALMERSRDKVEELRAEIPRIFEESGAIFVYATTEPEEALLLGGNTATLWEGRVTQFGPTPQVYRMPEDATTARVFSDPPMNFVSCFKEGNRVNFGGHANAPADGTFAGLPDGNGSGACAHGLERLRACELVPFKAAVDAVRSGSARCVLVVSPEITSAHLEWRDRDCHFIFGDVATAIVVEAADTCTAASPFEVLGTRLQTQFSNAIRNNFGFLNRCDESGVGSRDKLFRQEGRKVFKEVCPMVAEQIVSHAGDTGIEVAALKRLWLHQANINMNELIAKRVLGREFSRAEAPVILDEYANTSSAGSIIAFHKYQDDFVAGDVGVICSFGAGYSIGSVIVRRC